MSLSEDATRIVGRVQYASSSNQIVGFVFPINKDNGMPIPNTYQARTANEMIDHFTNGNPISSFVNVVMAQPLGSMQKVPPFCLLLFGSDSKYGRVDVSRRWKLITDALKKLHIQVLIISSDSDPKYNSSMRESLGRICLMVLIGLGAEFKVMEKITRFTYKTQRI